MGSKYADDLIDDDEVPELTEDFSKNALTFDQLPADLQHTLREIQRGNVTIKPDPVRLPVSVSLPADLVERFKAAFGENWEYKIEAALRHWLVEHPPAVKKERLGEESVRTAA
jgi:uncharacterized protein (DUF4415 family)